MKKIFITIGIILLLVGCGVSHDEPKEVATAFIEAYADNDKEEVEALVSKGYANYIKKNDMSRDKRAVHNIEFVSAREATNRRELEFNLTVEKKDGEMVYYTAKIKMERVPDRGWLVRNRRV